MVAREHASLTISGTTQLYGIMGYPVAHSWSPLMHTFALRHHHCDAIYMPFPVAPENLAQAVQGARALGVKGFNVTIPHKETVMAELDEVSAMAQGIGAVNTVVVRGNRTVGYNTDGEGFLQPLRAMHVDFASLSVGILGAGGAARAIAMALLETGCPSLTIANRTHERGERLAAALRGAFPQALLQTVPWSAAATVAQKSDLLVNTTSLGLHGETIFTDIHFQSGQMVYDIVYNPLETPLLQAARRAGATAIPGLDMLIGQGAVAFHLWTGLTFPVAEVRRLLQALLHQEKE